MNCGGGSCTGKVICAYCFKELIYKKGYWWTKQENRFCNDNLLHKAISGEPR